MKSLDHHLNDRFQYVQVRNIKSSKLPIRFGVPSWVLFFSSFLSELPQQCYTDKVAIYADDTTLRDADYNCERQLNDDIESLTMLIQMNLSVNISKCEFMTFGRSFS